MGTQWTPGGDGEPTRLARFFFGRRALPVDPVARKPGLGWRAYLWARKTRAAYGLRRFGNIYTHLVALDDKTVLAVLGFGWALWIVGAIIGPPVFGAESIPVGGIFGAVLIAATWLIGGWWLEYRRSGDRLKHELLAREVIAHGRELEAKVGAGAVTAKAATVRPRFTEQTTTAGREAALARQVLGAAAGERVKRAAIIAAPNRRRASDEGHDRGRGR